jgi:arylsulfatase A-like enzyme
MPDSRPNVLWLCTDQQRYDTIGALGNPYLRTPHIDRLVETGVAFTHAYCQSPICTPSRASFLYDCGLAGKLHLAGAHGRIEPRPEDGYRVFHWSHHPRDDWPEGHAYVDWLKSQDHDYKGLFEKHGSIPKELHQTTWCADRAIDFIRERRDGPWLFSFNCYDPHPPFDPPEEYVRPFDIDRLPGPLFRDSDLEAQRRLAPVVFQSEPAPPDTFDGKRHQARYWAQIALIDENVGRMVRALEESGQRDNTIVISSPGGGGSGRGSGAPRWWS